MTETAREPLRKPNHLISEKSPYLIEHAYNPVDWYPWGEEAFQKARERDKPIFLSIGYSSCHWCHRQRAESFEDEKIAAILNEYFVSIKVDREERPDVDEVYMKAVQAMTGGGGWPLSVFLTPDLKPFYGGTYFPPVPQHGLPAFGQVLNHIAVEWRKNREEMMKNGREISAFLKESYSTKSKGIPSEEILETGYANLISNYDPEYGGFGGSPKFPLPTYPMFLHRYFYKTKKRLALNSSLRTLDAMAAGGIHDHLAGGFHRYSTDRRWLVPHFEKMLYDNALLVRAYLEAYQLTQNSAYSITARDVLGWIMSEMTDPKGGIYSAQDADTEEGEGVYYTWTPDEIKATLTERESDIIDYFYGVTSKGNFEEGRTILHEENTSEKTAAKFNLNTDELEKLLEEANSKLLQARHRRPRPHTDDKILTSWNGLAISAFAYAYQALGEEVYLNVARNCADFILTHLYKDGRLLRRYRAGDAAIEATLEDYSYLIQGLIDLYEASLDPRWIREAVTLNQQMMNLFWDNTNGGFFFTSKREDLPAEIKEDYDGPTPSGNSVAALTLLRLNEFTGNPELKEKAETIFKVFNEGIEAQPSAHTYMLSALDFYYGAPKEIVVATESLEEGREMIREIQTRFLPNKVLSAVIGEEHPLQSSLTEGKIPIQEKPTVYICQNFTCKTPVTDLASLRSQLA